MTREENLTRVYKLPDDESEEGYTTYRLALAETVEQTDSATGHIATEVVEEEVGLIRLQTYTDAWDVVQELQSTEPPTPLPPDIKQWLQQRRFNHLRFKVLIKNRPHTNGLSRMAMTARVVTDGASNLGPQVDDLIPKKEFVPANFGADLTINVSYDLMGIAGGVLKFIKALVNPSKGDSPQSMELDGATASANAGAVFKYSWNPTLQKVASDSLDDTATWTLFRRGQSIEGDHEFHMNVRRPTGSKMVKIVVDVTAVYDRILLPDIEYRFQGEVKIEVPDNQT